MTVGCFPAEAMAKLFTVTEGLDERCTLQLQATAPLQTSPFSRSGVPAGVPVAGPGLCSGLLFVPAVPVFAT